MSSNKPYVDTLSQYLPQTQNVVPGGDYFSLQKEAAANQIEASKVVLSQAIEQKKQDQGSLVGRLNLDPNSLAGSLANFGASFASGAANMGGIVAALPLYLKGLEDINFEDEDFRAAERLNKGTASSADLDRLNRKASPEGNVTILDVIQSSALARESAKDVRSRFDLSGLVHQNDRHLLSGDIRRETSDGVGQIEEGWNQLKNYEDMAGWGNIIAGTGKTIAGGAKAIWNNPKATAEFTAENLPQIIAGGPAGTVGKAALTGFTGGYALDIYNEGIQQKIKDNGGQMPSLEERLKSLGWGVAAGAAEYASNAFLGGKIDGALPGGAGKAVSGFTSAIKTAAKDLGISMAEEGTTEAFQTFAEGAAAGKDADIAQIAEAGIIGASVGGHISGATSVPGILQSAIPKGSDPANDTSVGPTEAFVQAVQARDPAALLQPGEAFNPVEAVKVASHLLMGGEGTEVEQKAWKDTAEKALSEIEGEKSRLEALLDPAKLEAARSDLEAVKSAIAATPADDVAGLADLQEMEQRLTKRLDTQATQERLASIEETLSTARDVYSTAVGNKVALPDMTVRQAFEAANVDLTTADEATKAKAVEAVKSLVLSMASEKPLSAADAKALATNPNNGLSQDYRNYFLAFAEAMAEVGRVKNMEKVNTEILYGDTKTRQKGLLQYQSEIAKFLAAGEKAMALKELDGLRKFTTGQKSKAAALIKAIGKANQTGKNYQVIKKEGAWAFEPLALPAKELAKAGGLNIHRGSTNLVEAAQAEARALATSLKAMELATSLDLNQAPVEAVKPEPAVKAETADPVADLEKQRRKIKRQKSPSLYTMLRNSLNDADLNDIYGSEWKKKYTFLKGKQARPLIDQITDGLLDDFLPPNLRFGTGLEQGLDQEQAAEEFIKDKLRNQDYYTEDTKMALAQADLTIEQLEQSLTEKDVDEAIQEVQQKLADQATGQAGSPGPVEQAPAGEAAGGTVDTQGSETTTEQPGTESESVTEPVAEKTNGILDVLNNGASFLAGRIVQKLKGDSTQQQNPLVAVKDFLTAWKSGEVSPEQFINGELDEKQTAALTHFKEFAEAVSKAIPDVLRASPELKYARKNPAEFLMTQVNGKFDFPENVKTAMALAMVTWLADAMRSSAYNGKKEINQILGRDENTSLSQEAVKELAEAGARRSVVANELGKKIVQALGMSATSKAEKSILPRIESTLGGIALGFLVRKGVVVEKKISGETFSRLTESDSTAQYFVRPGFDARTKEWSSSVKRIAEPVLGTKNVLEKVFSVDPGLRPPSLKPVPFSQTKAKKSTMGVPKWLAAQLDKESKNGYYLDTDSFSLLASMSEDTVVGLQGAFNGDEGTRHKANRKSLQAKKDGLLREWRNLIEFVSNDLATSEQGTKSPFYFTPSVWKNQRVGLTNNMVNPQTSKIQRGLMFQESWKTEVDPTNQESLDAFKLRVLEKFGVKIEKAATEKVLTEWDGKVNQPEIQAAIQALSSWLDTKEMTPAIEQAIATGVAKAGEGMGSFNALMALAQMKRANGGKFITTLTAEIDGVANGPMLSMLLLGAAPSLAGLTQMLNLGGFFEQGKGIKNYNIFRGMPGVQDLYETAGSELMKVLATAKARPELGSLWYFLGEMTKDGKVTSAGRKVVKTPITALIFGASMTTATNNMVDDLVAGMYAAIEDVAAGKRSKTEVIGHINQFLPHQMKWKEGMDVSAMMDHVFTTSELASISKVFREVLGNHVKVALEPMFGTLTERRDVINKTSAAAYGLYASVKEVLTSQLREHLVKTGQAPSNSNGTPTWDLSPDQERILNRMTRLIEPVIHTVMSKADKSLADGILLAKQETKQSSSDLYHSTVQFAPSNLEGSMGIYSQERVLSEPGTMVLSTQTHSLDSGVSHFAADTQSLNVHDARIAGVIAALAVAQKMNQGVWESALVYSPVTEVYESYARSIKGLVTLLQPQANADVMVQALAPTILNHFAGLAKQFKVEHRKSKAETAQAVIVKILSDAKYQAYQADSLRLGVMAQLEAIDQYAAEGGQYDVTDQDRAKAAAQLKELSMGVPDAVLADVDALVNILAKAESSAEVAPASTAALLQAEAQGMAAEFGLSDTQVIRVMNTVAQSNEAPQEVQTSLKSVLAGINSGMVLADALADTLTQANARALLDFIKGKLVSGVHGRFGLLGKSHVAPVASLVSFFEANPVTTAKAVMDHLNGYLKKIDNPIAHSYRQMLYMASRAVGSDVKVVYVTPDTDPSLVKALPDVASRGWYDTANKTLYVLSPDHVESGLDSELLIHELTHAALHDIVDAPQTETQKQLMAELNTLMAQAKEQFGDVVAGSPLASALDNIHEFIAYGLTNRKFQKDVLGKMQVENTGKLRQLISGLQAFLTKLAGLLFNKELDVSSDTVDGFTAMVAHVTSLYQEVAQQQDRVLKQANNKSILSMASATNAILNFTTHQVFDALSAPGLSSQFQQKLDAVLTQVVNQVHGPFGAIKTQLEAKIGKTPLEAWQHAIQSGQRPFASKALNSGVLFTQKEAFVTEQVEATVRQVLDDKAAASSLVYRELQQLYQQAKEALRGKIPADTYAYVFQHQATGSGHTKSDYLSKFIALGLANEGFNKALAFQTRQAQFMSRGMTLTERLEAVWQGIIDFISARWTGTYGGQKADEKLNRLVSQLIQIESRYKVQVPGVNIVHDFLEKLSESGDGVVGRAKEKVAEIAESDFFTKSKYGPVRMVGAITAISARGRVEGVMEVISKIRNKHQAGADGTLAGLLTYVRGSGKWATALLMGTKRIEQQRQSIVSDVSKIILDSFKDGGQALSKEAKAGVTYTFLRTGAHSLLGQYDMAGIQELLDSPKALESAINDHAQMLKQYWEAEYYIKQAHGLGFYLATNKVGMHGQNTNSTAIARLFGTGLQAPAHTEAAALIIERLATLYALKEMGRDAFGRDHLKNAAEVLRDEMQRGDANGIEMTLLTHKALEKDARERLFSGGNEGLMVQGWLPEVSNPHTAFQVVRDPKEAQNLEDQGYEYVHEVALDSADPDRRPAKMYILRGGGLGRRQSGVFSLTDIGAKGASKHNQYYNPNDNTGVDNMQSMASIDAVIRQEVRGQFNPQPGFDPRAAARTNDYMLPLFNGQGQIVDYRYVMSARNRDTMLERDNRFEHLLGVSAGTTYDKLTSAEQNEKALQALHEHFTSNYSHSPSDFIHIAHNSSDPRMREIWAMLPEFTKRDVRKVWKSNGLWVPKNMVDVMFGYRKYSLAEAFEKANPNMVERVFMAGMTRILFDYARLGKRMSRVDAQNYAKRGAVVTRKAEAIWQELVHEAKDFIVIKGIEVMKDNMLSNAMMLMGKGVPMVQAFKDMFVAWRAAIEYDRDVHALRKLELLVETGYGSRSMADVKAKIAELQDSLARNPVTELVEAGLKPTIVEDVGMEDNPYSYKSQLAHWFEEKTSWVNPGVMKAGKFMYMTHDSWLYNLLNKTTQYSDFVARYALYKHQTERAKVRVSKADALFDAAETFVIYDVPLPKNIQYLDDMGITPFIKYFLSIQRVLGRMFKDKPLATLNMVATSNLLGNLPVPTDSSFVTRIGNNPFSAGALMLPNSMMEAASVQASLGLVK